MKQVASQKAELLVNTFCNEEDGFVRPHTARLRSLGPPCVL